MRVSRWAVAALAAGLGLVVYLRGAAPGVLTGDSAELQAAAFAGGVGHPSGYPTFLLFGQVFGRLLHGDPAWRMNAMTAFFGAAGLAALVLVLAEMGLSSGAALAGSLVYGASFTYWWASLRCEVYTLATTLFLLALWRALVAIRTRRLDDACAAAFLLGLTMTGHLVFGPAVLLLAALVALPLPLPGARRVAAWALLLALFVAGLSPYAALGFADRHTEATNYLKYSIELSAGQFGLTPETFWSPFRRVAWLLFGAESRPLSFAGHPRALARTALAGLAQLFLFEFGPLGLLLAAVGARRLGSRPWTIRLLVFGLAVIPLAIAAGLTVFDLLPNFLMPCAVAVAVLVALGIDAVVGPLERARGAAAGLAAGVLAAALVIPAPHLLSARSRAHPIGPLGWRVIEEWEPPVEGVVPSLTGFEEPRRRGERIMRSLPPHALVLGKWEEIMVLKYLQTIEGVRPDLTLDPYYSAHIVRIERWQRTHDLRAAPLAMVGSITELRPRFAAADSVDLGEAGFLLIQRSPLAPPARR